MTENEFQERFDRAYEKKQGGCFDGLFLILLMIFFVLPALALTALPFWGAMACRDGWVTSERFCSDMTSNPLVQWTRIERSHGLCSKGGDVHSARLEPTNRPNREDKKPPVVSVKPAAGATTTDTVKDLPGQA